MINTRTLRSLFLAPLFFLPTEAAMINLRILETTDLHANMMDYDYYQDKPTDRYGFTRTATLIEQARYEVKNSVLVDNGDLLQGSPLGDYIHQKGLNAGNIHPIYKAMNSVNYTVGNLGNHDFNYGLDFLRNAIAGATFPYINANVYDKASGKHAFTPYIIIDTPVVDSEGQKHTLKIAYIGFVPPQILQWDKTHLEGKVTVADITETARKLVPEIKQAGADLIIAIPHSGISTAPYTLLAENSVYYLSTIKGIDAILFGHSHGLFPSNNFANIDGINIEKGLINGVPATMPGQWGDHLGVIDLALDRIDGKWTVVDASAAVRPIFDVANKKPYVDADASLVALLNDDHKNTQIYMNQPVGKSTVDMFSYLSALQADASIQIIHDAQRAYTEHHIQGDPDLSDLPILSAVAPFKAGGRKNDPFAYVEVPKGSLSVRNVADLYVFPNTFAALKITGKNVKEWLECSAGMYNQIDPTSTAPQSLINWAGFRLYNFDSIDGVNYEIDITQPPRYDGECNLINPSAERIKHLTFNEKPLDLDQPFIIASNNYRAFTGKFSGTGTEHVVINSPDELKTVIASYILQQTEKNGSVTVKEEGQWRIQPINTKTALDIRLETSPSERAAAYINAKAQYPMTYLATDDIGFAVYRVNLQQ